MLRCSLVALVFASALCPASFALQNKSSGSQKAIPWSNKVEECISTAKKTQRPLMIFIEGDYNEVDDRTSEPRRKSMQDPRVLFAVRNFVAIQIPRTHSKYKSLFEKLQVPDQVTLEIVFATPEGERIDNFQALHQAETFAQKAAAVFRSYRSKLLESELKPKLEDSKTSTTELKKIFKLIGDFAIVEADGILLDLPEKRRLDEGSTKELYETLAELSTPKAVDFLLEKAGESSPKSSAAAADALTKCTPAAAEYMTKALSAEDADERLVVYKALVKISKIPTPKPDKFWEGKNQRLISDEIERVKKEVEKDVKKGRDLAEYR